ncbi:hypothetical protein GCM10008941_14510 [Rhizomicrobium palustre]
MEEILASIRKIISEDSSEPQAASEAAKEAEPESDILELTHEVPPEPVVEAAPEPVMEEPVLETPAIPEPQPENDVVFEPIDEPEPAPVAEASSDIFSSKTREHLENAFAALDEPEEEEYAAPAYAPSSSASGLSVEAVFERAVNQAFEPVAKQWLGENAPQLIERMKPLIREWMDEHFPALLEGAVRDEVARVAKARGAKR